MTIDIAEDALLAASTLARREQIPLGDAIPERVGRGACAVGTRPQGGQLVLPRDQFALLPARDEIITPQQVRDLM